MEAPPERERPVASTNKQWMQRAEDRAPKRREVLS